MRPLKNDCEVAVIGGGLAGLAAARHAVRLGRLVTLFESAGLFGGQVATVGHVDGLPIPGHFSGQDIAIPLLEEIRKVGVQIVETGISKIELGKTITLRDQGDKTYHPEAIIIASGASLRKLGIPGEDEFLGRGVSQCATCDGGFFRGQDVVVVGGGDGAVHEALELSPTAKRVFMVCRSPLRAKREYIDRLAARENVSFLWDSEVREILGGDGVRGVRLKNVKNGTSLEIECAGLFPFVGAEPNSAFVPPSLVSATGHIPTNADYGTIDPRVFAVGAVRAGYGGNIGQAMADGIGAAEAVTRLCEARL